MPNKGMKDGFKIFLMKTCIKGLQELSKRHHFGHWDEQRHKSKFGGFLGDAILDLT